MRTLVNGTLIVQAYDAKVWKQERNLLRVTDPLATSVSLYHPTPTTKVATYTLDGEHKVDIDLSDFIRLHDSGVNDVFVRTDGGAAQYVVADFEVVGLIDPRSAIIPRSFTGMPIEPPSMMYVQAFPNVYVRFEACADTTANIYVIGSGESGYVVSNWVPDVCSNNRMNSVRVVYFYMPDAAPIIKTLYTRVLDDCKRYAAVRWVSFTGQTRLHTWEVTKAKTATRDAIELLTIDGSYNTIKGREDGFVLRLDGLNAYDMWYYVDIITSSKVEVSMDGYTWQRVDITTKDIKIPDGNAGKLNTLEVNCNWRKYDAITL